MNSIAQFRFLVFKMYMGEKRCELLNEWRRDEILSMTVQKPIALCTSFDHNCSALVQLVISLAVTTRSQHNKLQEQRNGVGTTVNIFTGVASATFLVFLNIDDKKT